MERQNLAFEFERILHSYARLPLAMAAKMNVFAYVANELSEAIYGEAKKPEWGITSTEGENGEEIIVTNTLVLDRPFLQLRRFASDRNLPEVLVIAPLSGHYATLLRGHVRALLAHFNVTITDWNDPRDIPHAHGDFGVDDYVDEIGVAFAQMRKAGGFHTIAVCQPGPLALLALARAEELDSAKPRSLTLIAAPIDTRKNPTHVNELAIRYSEDFFRNQIETVAHDRPGKGRAVYPAHLQLAGFMMPNMRKHVSAHVQNFVDRLFGDHEAAKKHDDFYAEFNAVMPLPQPYHMDTLARVFKEHHLPKGRWMHRGEVVSLEKIHRTRLLCIEGERDDICGRGQTSAAIDLCTGLSARMKRTVIIPGAGHYGAFQGSAFKAHGLPAIIEIAK